MLDEVCQLIGKPAKAKTTHLAPAGIPENTNEMQILGKRKSIVIETEFMTDTEASPFICLHRALRWLPKGLGIFSVLLDTALRISNLAPPVELDSSECVVGGRRRLFSPLYLIASMDVDVLPIHGCSLEEIFKPG